MASTIDSTGFKKQRYQELRFDIAKTWADDYGLPDVSNNTTSVPGRMVSQQANLQERNDSFAQAVMDSFNPYNATGAQLSRLAPVMGKTRNQQSFSIVAIEITADSNGANVPSGFQVSDPNNSDIRFQTTLKVQIAPNSSRVVTARSTIAGSIKALPATLTKINTPIFGVVSVNNSGASTVGSPRETDPQLRFRMLRSSAQDITTLLGAFSAISEIDGVTYVSIHDKSSPSAVALGIADGEVFYIIDGGDRDVIANTMMTKTVAGGIITKNNVTGATIVSVDTINPANKQPVTYYYAVPTEKPVHVAIEVTQESGVAPDYVNSIKESIKTYIDSLDVGSKIMASRVSAAAQCATVGFDVVDCKIGITSTPTDNTIQLAPFERATIKLTDIVVTVS